MFQTVLDSRAAAVILRAMFCFFFPTLFLFWVGFVRCPFVARQIWRSKCRGVGERPTGGAVSEFQSGMFGPLCRPVRELMTTIDVQKHG